MDVSGTKGPRNISFSPENRVWFTHPRWISQINMIFKIDPEDQRESFSSVVFSRTSTILDIQLLLYSKL